MAVLPGYSSASHRRSLPYESTVNTGPLNQGPPPDTTPEREITARQGDPIVRTWQVSSLTPTQLLDSWHDNPFSGQVPAIW